MPGIRIVTDSTGYISKEDAQKGNIRIVPLAVTFSGETEEEGFPGEFEKFYNKLAASTDFPTTSQPSIEAFAEVFRKEIEGGNEVITIVISSKLSGTYNSASAAAAMTAPDKISVIDSETSVANLRLLVIMANDMAEKGRSRQSIVEAIEQAKKRMSINLTVDTLEYLKRGGRLTSAQALIGSLLNVKPIISLIDGKLEAVAKVRGKSKALDYMIDQIPANVTHIAICHILDLDEAEQLCGRIQQMFRNVRVELFDIGPVIGSHLGPKAIGVCCKW